MSLENDKIYACPAVHVLQNCTLTYKSVINHYLLQLILLFHYLQLISSVNTIWSTIGIALFGSFKSLRMRLHVIREHLYYLNKPMHFQIFILWLLILKSSRTLYIIYIGHVHVIFKLIQGKLSIHSFHCITQLQHLEVLYHFETFLTLIYHANILLSVIFSVCCCFSDH